MLFSLWGQKYKMQTPLANTSDVTRLSVSRAPGFVALETISPTLRGLRLRIIVLSLMGSRGQALRKGSAGWSWLRVCCSTAVRQ